MANQSYHQRSGNRSFYPSLASMSSSDPGQLYTRDMGPPSSDFPPRPVEIDLNTSRTLPNPSASAPMWDPTVFQAPGFGELGPYGASSIPRMSTVPNESQSRGPSENPLLQWYTGNDGPWNPIPKVNTEAEDRSLSKQTGNRNPIAYAGQYRQNPSETGHFHFGVPHSDSGYGTRRSVGNTSVFSADVHERDQDSHSLVGPVPDFNSFHGYNEVLQQRDSRGGGSWTPPSSHPSDSPGLVCPDCHKPVKTQSELKKHDLRHRKPFVCEVPGCNRTEGFSTTNDLDRHTKSKHPSAIPENTATKKFRCHVPGCKSKDKAWPRLDNFRSHLKRVHQNQLRSGEEFEDMIRRAEFWERTGINLDQEVAPIPQRNSVPELARPSRPVANDYLPRQRRDQDWKLYPEIIDRSQSSMAPNGSQLEAFESKTIVPVEDPPQHEEPLPATIQPVKVFPAPAEIPKTRITLDSLIRTPTNIDPTLKKSTQAKPSVSLQGKAVRQTQVSAADATLTEVIQKVLAGANISDPSSERVRDSERSSLPNEKISPRDPWSAGPNAATSNSRGSNDHINHAAAPSAEDASKDLESRKKALEVLKIIRDLGFTVSQDTTHAPKVQNPGSAASNKSENQVTCQQCGKFKGRPCELKKHMKRHERPYGCTFPTCNKLFGSKNDWKRHENSQHFHLETWRCDIERPEGGACAKVCYRRQTFQDHLKKEHQLSDGEPVKKKVDSCRIGRNCQARFWCGFCAKLVDLKKKGLDAWTERFDHIDDHFMGRHGLVKRIHDWIPVDGDQPKGDVGSPHSLGESPGKESLDREVGSPSGSGHEPESSGRSSAHAIVLEDGSSHLKRGRVSSSEDDSRPAKHVRASKTHETRVYCCQCKEPHNLRFNQSCTNCPDFHRFCNACVTENIQVDS